VFGTPLAAALFALEVLAIGRMDYRAILPCLFAAIVADQVGLMWGVQHTHYLVTSIPALSAWTLLAVILAGCCFGLAARLFADTTHLLSSLMKKQLPYAPLRPFIGGLVIATAVSLLHGERYIGLGIPEISDAFCIRWQRGIFGKLIFTVISLEAVLKAGSDAAVLHRRDARQCVSTADAPACRVPRGLGFVALFAGAANTPVASTLMAIELFGAEIGVYAALACVVAYLVSGYTGIYRAQRIAGPKHRVPTGIRLAELPAWHQRQTPAASETKEDKHPSR
jgi:H+/Cl- antiporter ClcA